MLRNTEDEPPLTNEAETVRVKKEVIQRKRRLRNAAELMD